MQKITVGVIFLVLVVAFCSATNSNGFLYPFDINNLIDEGQCLDDAGRPIVGLPTVPLFPEERNDGFIQSTVFTNTEPFDVTFTYNVTYQHWLPQPSGFRYPSLEGVDTAILRRFLGQHFNEFLTSIDPPVREAPRACDFLPAVEPMPGQQRMHVEEVNESITLYDPNNPSPLTSRFYVDVDREIFDLPESRFVNPNAWSMEPELGTDTIIQEGNRYNELCDLWVARCPLMSRWVRLHETYFPRYMSISVCSQKNCSIPVGLTCQEDFLYRVQIPVLRWDCCFARYPQIKEARWECGWRKVQVPVFCDCTCNCSEVYTPLDKQ